MMTAIEYRIRRFQAKAQDISHGIWTDAGSLADCVEAGQISTTEAETQLAELRERLQDAAMEG